jgi:outer membrane lipoprotein-sorting protein
MKTIFTFIIIAITLNISAQKAEDIIAKLNAKYNSIKDYTVNANIKADIPMLKIMPNKAVIYYKQKDKFKIDSKGITVLPKQGFTEINAFLSDKSKYMAVIGDSLIIKGVQTVLINIIPNNAGGEMILAKLWVDVKNYVIMRSQITTKTNGTIFIDYTYGDQITFGLPSEMKFEIDVKKFKMPKSVSGDINNTKNKDQKKKNKTKGTITITLSEYKVNTGLKDSIFKEQKK